MLLPPVQETLSDMSAYKDFDPGALLQASSTLATLQMLLSAAKAGADPTRPSSHLTSFRVGSARFGPSRFDAANPESDSLQTRRTDSRSIPV